MPWNLLASSLVMPAWALVPLGTILMRKARSGPSPGRRLGLFATGLALIAPAVVCSSVVLWHGLVVRS